MNLLLIRNNVASAETMLRYIEEHPDLKAEEEFTAATKSIAYSLAAMARAAAIHVGAIG